MQNIFTATPKFHSITKLFAVFMIVSIIVPNALLASPLSASAEEVNPASAPESVSADSTPAPETPIKEAPSIDPIESNDTDGADSGSTDNNGGNGGGNSSNENNASLLRSPVGATGSITFCTMITDTDGRIKTDATGLPEGSFHIELIDATSTAVRNVLGESTIGTAQFQPFAVNTKILPTSPSNDADCVTFSNLPIITDGGYYYTEQNVSGVAINAWQTPRYNDQLSAPVSGVNDFYLYNPELFDNDASNDERRNQDADGYIILSPERPNRTLVIMNRYTPGNQAPEIQITGPNPMEVLLHGTYHELGAVATDDHDDVTGLHVTPTGTVNTEVLGTYYIHYNVTDNDGAAAIEQIRTVYVVDHVSNEDSAPIITVLGDNPMNVVVGTTFTDPFATAFDIYRNENLTTHIQTSGTVDTNTIGTYTISYDVRNRGGLPAETKTRTVNVVANDNGNGGNGGNGGGSSGSRRSSSGGRRAPQGEVLGATTGPIQPCVYLTDYMHTGWQNSRFEVIKLQSFLKYMEGYTDLEPTGIFDQATFAAVSSFQEKYAADILTPWGHDKGTGFVYILTKKKINEIYCQQAFPITAPQAEEIANYKAFLAGLKASGISNPTDTNVLDNNATQFNSDLKDIKDIVGSAESTSNPTVIVDNSLNFGKLNAANVRAAAAAIFSFPKDRGMLLQSLYFLLIALIAIYLLIEIIVGSMNTASLTKYQIWSRKAAGYLLGLIIAIIVAVWYKIFSIVMPMLLLAIASGAFLAWAMTKRSGDQVISLPPTNK